MGRSELSPPRRLIQRRIGQTGRRPAGIKAAAAFAGLLFSALLAGQAIGAAAPVLVAELPKGFDDYTPPSKTEQLPPEGGQGGGTTGGGETGGGGATVGGGTSGTGGTAGSGKLTHQHILGSWCSTTSNYIIGRTQLTVILTDGSSRSTYRVFDFDFTETTVAVRWITADNRRVRTTFGRFSSDGRQMVQLFPNRVYRRCQAPGTQPLSYPHILGSWCDDNSKYIITRTLLTVVFSGGRRVTYKITGFKFLKDVVEVYWVDNTGKRLRTRFGEYAANRRSMTQLGPNRTYSRC